jgi:hypothetical protein
VQLDPPLFAGLSRASDNPEAISAECLQSRIFNKFPHPGAASGSMPTLLAMADQTCPN